MTFDELVINSLRKQNTEKKIEISVLSQYSPTDLFFLRKDEDFDFIKHRLEFIKSGYLELLEVDDFSSVNTISATSIFVFGFVIGMGNKVFIYNNIDESNNVLVELNLTNLSGYSLFPGQVIALKGFNTNGNEITVSIIYDLPVLPINFLEESEQKGVVKNSDSFSVCFISGPFNHEITEETLALPNSYDFFYKSLDNILSIDSDFLVIFGPLIESRFLETSLDLEKVENIFQTKINTWTSKAPTRKAITIPSIDDVHTLGMYPCGPFKFTNNKIQNISNPSQFYIENVLFGLCTNDLLLQMTSSEIVTDNEYNLKTELSSVTDHSTSKYPKNSKRIERLSAHLIYQRSFLPCFPPQKTVSINNPKCFDMDVAPDFFIISSKLKTFIQKDTGPFIIANIGCQPKIANKLVLRILVNQNSYDFDERFSVKFERFIK